MDNSLRCTHLPDSAAISGFNTAYNRYDDYRRKRCQETAWPFNPPALELLTIWSPTREPLWSAAAESLRCLRVWAGGLAHSTANSIGHNSESSARIMQEACDEAEAAGLFFAEMEAAVDGQGVAGNE